MVRSTPVTFFFVAAMLALGLVFVPLQAGELPECGDGLDNDGDTLIDYPADPGCSAAAGPSEMACQQGVDADGDGIGAACDCNDGDLTAAFGPLAVTGVALEKIDGGVRLWWDDQGARAGSGTVYDVYSVDGGIVRSTGGDFSSGQCVVEGVSPTYDYLAPDPAPGVLELLLMRAENGCSTGPYGDTNRDVTAALSASPCGLAPEGICGDGLDNDDDGAADCADPDCASVATCTNDTDSDGWTGHDGDCCVSTAQCPNPDLVNPGALEILGNGIDDDCDPATLDDTPPAACSTTADLTVTPEQLAGAMELCQTTTASPPLADRKWGLISAELRRADGSVPSGSQLSDMQNLQSAVMTLYGNTITPQAGATMAGMSTGNMRYTSQPDFASPDPGTNHGWAGLPPAAYLAAHGGNLPDSIGCGGTCTAGVGANDPVNLRLTIRVPTNVQALSYDLRFFSADYANYSCTTYNDFHLSLLTSGAAGIPADKNIATDGLGNPLTVNSDWIRICPPQGCYTCPYGTSQLMGTGMESSGAGTEWQTITAPVVPGETIVLELMVFDVSDNIEDALHLLDNFRWEPIPVE